MSRGEVEGGERWLLFRSPFPSFCVTGCELNYEQTVMEANEDAGEIELLRISKKGETELPVKIYISGSMCNKIILSECTCVCVSKLAIGVVVVVLTRVVSLIPTWALLL